MAKINQFGKSYEDDINDMVEDVTKGGPGSGTKGHKTNKISGTHLHSGTFYGSTIKFDAYHAESLEDAKKILAQLGHRELTVKHIMHNGKTTLRCELYDGNTKIARYSAAVGSKELVYSGSNLKT